MYLHLPYDFPLSWRDPDYVHRIGRTARAGVDGDAISFACEEFSYSLPDIETFIGHEIPRGSIDENMLAVPLPPAPIARRGKPPTHRKGGRPKRRSNRGR